MSVLPSPAPRTVTANNEPDKGPTQWAPASWRTSLGAGRSGLGFWFPTLPVQTPRKAWKQVVPCHGLGAPESTLPPNTHQLELLYLKTTQAQRCCGVVQPPPTSRPAGSGRHRRLVAHTEIPRAVGWREVEPGALKWLPLARPWPGRALGSHKTQKMGNIRACHCAVAGVSGGASGGSQSLHCPFPLPGPQSRFLVPIPVL